MIFFDVETQLSADDVGGWDFAEDMRVSYLVAYNTASDDYLTCDEDNIPHFIDLLTSTNLVVGFNIEGFDYKVLSRYTDIDLWALPTFDLLSHLHATLGHRVSLDTLAQANFGRSKLADGIEAIRWFKEGESEKIIEYCRDDVEITQKLFHKGCEDGALHYLSIYGTELLTADTSHWSGIVQSITR